MPELMSDGGGDYATVRFGHHSLLSQHHGLVEHKKFAVVAETVSGLV